jgi:uncharacterized protein YaaR (DUF327 family)
MADSIDLPEQAQKVLNPKNQIDIAGKIGEIIGFLRTLSG